MYRIHFLYHPAAINKKFKDCVIDVVLKDFKDDTVDVAGLTLNEKKITTPIFHEQSPLAGLDGNFLKGNVEFLIIISYN